MAREFKCALCKGEFESAWTEQEAEQELSEKFPGIEKEDCDPVCDECYKLIESAGLDRL